MVAVPLHLPIFAVCIIRDIFVCFVKMASCSGVQAIRMGQSTWMVGETVRTVRSNVFKRHILEPVFGAQWKTALIEGKFAGHGGTRKYRIERTSFNPPLVEEYGAQYGMFVTPIQMSLLGKTSLALKLTKSAQKRNQIWTHRRRKRNG